MMTKLMTPYYWSFEVVHPTKFLLTLSESIQFSYQFWSIKLEVKIYLNSIYLFTWLTDLSVTNLSCTSWVLYIKNCIDYLFHHLRFAWLWCHIWAICSLFSWNMKLQLLNWLTILFLFATLIDQIITLIT